MCLIRLRQCVGGVINDSPWLLPLKYCLACGSTCVLDATFGFSVFFLPAVRFAPREDFTLLRLDHRSSSYSVKTSAPIDSL